MNDFQPERPVDVFARTNLKLVSGFVITSLFSGTLSFLFLAQSFEKVVWYAWVLTFFVYYWFRFFDPIMRFSLVLSREDNSVRTKLDFFLTIGIMSGGLFLAYITQYELLRLFFLSTIVIGVVLSLIVSAVYTAWFGINSNRSK